MSMHIKASTLWKCALLVMMWSCKTRTFQTHVSTKNELRARFVPFDVNDVSVLFPLPPQFVPPQKAADVIDQQMLGLFSPQHELLSRAHFSALMRKSFGGAIALRKDGAAIVQKYSDPGFWKVVGFRVEPCFKAPFASETTCKPEVRLVIQPVVGGADIVTIQNFNTRYPNWSGSNPTSISPEDYAMHLIYDVPRAEFPKLVQMLYDIKLKILKEDCSGIDALGVGLGVHPALARENPDSQQVNRLFHNLIRMTCTPARLREIAVLGTAGMFAGRAESAWTFSNFSLHGGELRQETLKGVADAQGKPPTFQSLRSDLGYEPGVRRPSETFHDVVVEWQKTTDERGGLPSEYLQVPEVRQKIVEVAARVDDPSATNIRMTDCVTCHYSSTLRMLSSEGAFDRIKYKSNDRTEILETYLGSYLSLIKLPKGPTFTPRDVLSPYPFPEYNLRQFGYFFLAPAVSQRTINDSVYAADYLNRYASELLGR